MDRDEELARAVRQKDVRAISALLFEGSDARVRSGFKSEGELWDFKKEVPLPGANQAHAWASLAKDVVAFHNLKGGVVVFGVDDALEVVRVVHRLDSKMVNDRLRKYIGDVIWCEFHREFIAVDQTYIGLLLVPPRGSRLLRFAADAYDQNGRLLFRAGESALREGDSSRLLRGREVEDTARRLSLPRVAKQFEVDEPYFRVLAPDYAQFVYRPALTESVERALADNRVTTASLLGIGGAGKTALATWATLRAYDRQDFDFIVSMTAKDRELTPAGIVGMAPGLSSFEGLLDAIAEILGFPDIKQFPVEEREEQVRELLHSARGLLYVDNLETVDDNRIISFLDELPAGVRAIVTSRRSRVRVSVRPIEVGPLSPDEIGEFVGSLSALPGYGYIADLRPAEIERIGMACDGVPLAIRWSLARATSAAEAVYVSDGLTKSGRRGDELLEFSFRRVFEGMSSEERRILETLALFQAPLSTEALLVGAGISRESVADPRLLDAIEDLVDDALMYRVFDSRLNDYSHALLPITRAFVASELGKNQKRADEIRRKLTDYYEAKDVRDADARLAIRESRQGNTQSETSLLDLAIGARSRGDAATAQQLFEQALARNPRSWKVAREYAEFQRHVRRNTSEALRLYAQAAANAPSRGADRALIYREWGMLLRDSGEANATRSAIECFEKALDEVPNDPVAAHALATMLMRQGAYRRVIDLCEPMLESSRLKTREMAAQTLLDAYERTNEMIKHASLKGRLGEFGITR